MRVLLLSLGIFLLSVVPSLAQTVTGPSPVLLWDQSETSLANVQGGTFRLYEGTNVITLTHNCAGTASPFACSAQIPAMTPGNKEISLTFSRTIEGKTVESLKSSTLSITVLIVAAPQNLRIG